MDVCADEYTLKQLRAWLVHLNQPSTGNKATLVLRLNNIAEKERGICPSINENADGNQTNDIDDAQNADHCASIINNENVDAETEGSNTNENIIICDNGAIDLNVSNSLQNLEKELQLIKKERDLLLKQNELLKQSTTPKEKNMNLSENDYTTSFRMLKEFIPEFDGTSNVNTWTCQLKSLGETYNLNSNTMRALIMTKLRGKAQKWLYALPDYTTVEVDGLLEKLEELFDAKETQMTLRRKLEQRKWQHDETFSQYMYEKSLLATKIHISENELVDYIIDGITDTNLQTQAHMLCLTTKKQLSDAYSKVKLPKPQKTHERTVAVQKEVDQKRCFNCNSVGHLASDCKKPKREPGSCYGCGSMQHRVMECPQRKKPILTIHTEDEADDYNVS